LILLELSSQLVDLSYSDVELRLNSRQFCGMLNARLIQFRSMLFKSFHQLNSNSKQM
jgi:hypothetical protein